MGIIGGPDKIYVQTFVMETGDQVASKEIVSAASSTARCLWTDGMYVYAITDVLSTDEVHKLMPQGNTFILIDKQTISIAVNITDACYDGKYTWTLDATNVRKWEDPMLQNQLDVWAHGITTPQGIFHDGEAIIITDQ